MIWNLTGYDHGAEIGGMVGEGRRGNGGVRKEEEWGREEGEERRKNGKGRDVENV